VVRVSRTTKFNVSMVREAPGRCVNHGRFPNENEMKSDYKRKVPQTCGTLFTSKKFLNLFLFLSSFFLSGFFLWSCFFLSCFFLCCHFCWI